MITHDDYMKRLMIDALIGAGTGSIDNTILLTKLGHVKFTGNQHNEAWEWNVDYLSKLTVLELEQIYVSVKGYGNIPIEQIYNNWGKSN